MKGSPLISIAEAAQLLGCSKQTVRRFAHAHLIDGWRLHDRAWMKVYLASVERYIAARRRANFHGSSDSKSKPKPKAKTQGKKR